MRCIFRVAARAAESVKAAGADLGKLVEPEETELLKELGGFPDVVARAAETLEPHRVTGYLEGLARLAHAWYHKYRVLGEPQEALVWCSPRPCGRCSPTAFTSWGSAA